jgi:hypothetical protein
LAYALLGYFYVADLVEDRNSSAAGIEVEDLLLQVLVLVLLPTLQGVVPGQVS